MSDCPPCDMGAFLNRAERTAVPKSDPVRVFVGGGPEHWLPTQVLRSSILRRTKRDVKITPLLKVEKEHPVPERWRSKAPTSFSFQRFLIPAACKYDGFGVYLDSDQIVLSDIGGLWDTQFPSESKVLTTGGWQSAVMLIDCTVARWDINALCAKLDDGFKYRNISNLKFMGEREVKGALDPLWNCTDEWRLETKLLHFTGMSTQPWLRKGHPFGDVWLNELLTAIEERHVTLDDVKREIEAGHVRPSLAEVVGVRTEKTDDQFIFPDDKRRSS